MSLRFGTAPDSWGVWLPDHPSQPSWKQFLDETVESGYHILELGPYGYLPTEPEQLREELSIRNLSLIAGTMVADVMHLPGNTDALVAEVRKVCELAAPLGAKFFVLMVEGYRDDDGTLSGPSNLTGQDWATFVSNCNLIGKLIVEEFGMELTFHPHADSGSNTHRRWTNCLTTLTPILYNSVSIQGTTTTAAVIPLHSCANDLRVSPTYISRASIQM